MKRILVSIGLLLSSFACSGTSSETTKAPVATPAPAPAPILELPDDPYAAILPLGSFADVEALCAKQMELIVPRTTEVTKSFREYGWLQASESIKPSCEESPPSALKDTQITLGGPFLDAKAITVETGNSTDTFLIVQTTAGWTVVRDALLSTDHNDPGCGSIERTRDIVEARVEGTDNTIVILTTSDRSWLHDDRGGLLVLTHARACRLGEWGPTCSAAKTVTARLETQPADREATPIVTEMFSTPFLVDDGEILPAKPFDEENL